MNSVNITGNLTKDPELGKAGEAPVCNMRIAHSGPREQTLYVDVAAFGPQAAACAKHLRRGSRVGVSGYLHYAEWSTEDGSMRSKHSVTARRVEFLDPAPAQRELAAA